MMKDIRKYLKLIKYGYNIKRSIGFPCLFIFFGIIYILYTDSMLMIGGMCIFVGMLYVIQVVQALLFSEMVASSPQKRKLEILFSDILLVISTMAGMLLFFALLYLKIHVFSTAPMQGSHLEISLIASGIIIMGVLICIGIAFKHFAYGLVIALLLALTGFCIESTMILFFPTVFEGKMAASVLIFIGEIIVGVIVSMILRRIFYRASLSKLAVM